MTELATNREQFIKQVEQDIRDQLPANLASQLREQENIERWLFELRVMKRSIELKLVNSKAEFSEVKAGDDLEYDEFLEWAAKRDRWRSNIIRVKTSVENRIDEANLIKKTRIQELESAIRKHKFGMKKEIGLSDASEIDYDLWSVINE